MPTVPANADQQKVLNNLVDLAQTASVDAVNQIALVDRQMQDMDKATTLFTSRYNAAHTYISTYETEKKYLNGIYLTNPLPNVDTTQYPLAGNVFSDFVNVVGSTLDNGGEEPVRISQFDGTGTTSIEETRESLWLNKEASARDILLNGFNDNSVIGNIVTKFALTPSITSTTFTSNGTSPSLTAGGRILISSGTTSCIAKVLTSTHNQPQNSGDPHTWDVTLEYQTSFTSIPALATVSGSCAGFSNTERTSKVATQSYRQTIFDSLMLAYLQTIQGWSTSMNNQKTAFTSVQEDAPDSSYLAAHSSILTLLNNWITTPVYSDAGLSNLITASSSRGNAIPTRVSWINARLTASGVYDDRYKYSNLLFNKATGSYVQWFKFKQQKEGLQAQQPKLAQRAAAYQAENY